MDLDMRVEDVYLEAFKLKYDIQKVETIRSQNFYDVQNLSYEEHLVLNEYLDSQILDTEVQYDVLDSISGKVLYSFDSLDTLLNFVKKGVF